MKKKIKDVTIRELNRVCVKTLCYECPLRKACDAFAPLRGISDAEQIKSLEEEEIEIPEGELK